MALDKFSIEECKIMWFKDAEITPKQKQAMKAELKTMSGIIADAMKFIEEKRLDDREIYLEITFNSRGIEEYMLEITGEGDEWGIDISDLDHRFAGNIVRNCHFFHAEMKKTMSFQKQSR
jgi:hypothetical protein